MSNTNTFDVFKGMNIPEVFQGLGFETEMVDFTLGGSWYANSWSSNPLSTVVGVKLPSHAAVQRIPLRLPTTPAYKLDVSARIDDLRNNSNIGHFDIKVEQVAAVIELFKTEFDNNISPINVLESKKKGIQESMREGIDNFITDSYTFDLYPVNNRVVRQVVDLVRPKNHRYYAHSGDEETKAGGDTLRQILQNTDQPMTLKLLEDAILTAKFTIDRKNGIEPIRSAYKQISKSDYVSQKLECYLNTAQVTQLKADPRFEKLHPTVIINNGKKEMDGHFDYRSASFHLLTFNGVDIYHAPFLDSYTITDKADGTNQKNWGVIRGAGSVYVGTYGQSTGQKDSNGNPIDRIFEINKQEIGKIDDYLLWCRAYCSFTAPRMCLPNGEMDPAGAEIGVFHIFSA